MKPTRISMLLAMFVVATSLGWSLARVVNGRTGQVSLVGWSMPGTMGLLTLALLIWTLLARPRLLRKPGHAPLPPLVAARTAALALAASRVGALVGGVHAGFVLAVLPRLQSSGGRSELVISGVTVFISIAFVAVGRWLESLCRVKPRADADGGGSRAGSAKDAPAGSAARSPIT